MLERYQVDMQPMPWNTENFRLVIGRTKIDYDPNKENANQRRHGRSLKSAAQYLTRLLLPISQPPFITRDASTVEERRYEHMTVDEQGKIVFFVTTMRADETVRVISMRRAHQKERQVFAMQTGFKEVPKPKATR